MQTRSLFNANKMFVNATIEILKRQRDVEKYVQIYHNNCKQKNDAYYQQFCKNCSGQVDVMSSNPYLYILPSHMIFQHDFRKHVYFSK